jgi:hypothetical protein
MREGKLLEICKKRKLKKYKLRGKKIKLVFDFDPYLNEAFANSARRYYTHGKLK